MVGEPQGETFNAGSVHGVYTFIQHLCSLGQNLRHGAGLQLAQFNEQRSVEQFEIRGTWHAE